MPKWCLLAVLAYVTWSQVSQLGTRLGGRHLSAPVRGSAGPGKPGLAGRSAVRANSGQAFTELLSSPPLPRV